MDRRGNDKMQAIGYVRVSTDEQGKSGLGLEAQRTKIEQYCELYGLELVEVYEDAASGKTLDRTGLQDALTALTAAKGRCLVTAKLDRLTRSVRDLGDLLARYFNNGHPLKIVVEQVDTETAAGRMVANLLVTIAQWERETISERTQDALAAAKRRGQKLGNPQLDKVRPKAWRMVSKQADERAKAVLPVILEIQDAGIISYEKIAAALNARGISTPRGARWYGTSVKNVLARVA